MGLDLITLPPHTSHTLQPLYVSCFKLSKTTFCDYREVWTLANKEKDAKKEDLVQWVSLAFKKALTFHNVLNGFEMISIWPLNLNAMVGKMHH